MRNSKYRSSLFLLMGLSLLFISCSKEKDYSSITYRNYLRYEINRSMTFLSDQVEGTNEGEYKTGSMEAYQAVIEEADLVCEDDLSVQNDIDQSYKTLVKAGEDFFDQMVPFKKSFEELITDADFALEHAVEGEQEGNVKPGSKSLFQTVIENAKLTINRADLTQRMIDSERIKLMNAFYSFDNSIIGKAGLFLENYSFESPAFNTTDFAEVPGWDLFGKVETWAPKAEVYQGGTPLLPLESVPDGEFVVKIGSYTQGIYQQVQERIHPNAKYTLGFKASLLENWPDAFGNEYKVVVLSRIIAFDNTVGDYRFMSVISESYDTLGLDPGDFIELKQEINIGATSAFLERKFAVDFLVRHSFETAKPIWAEAYVAIDEISLFRKQN
jgi:hypothetical protein